MKGVNLLKNQESWNHKGDGIGENSENAVAQFRYISAWETGSETSTPKRGSGEQSSFESSFGCF